MTDSTRCLLLSSWAKKWGIVVDLRLVEIDCNILVLLTFTLWELREQRLFARHKHLLRYFHSDLLFARRSSFNRLPHFLNSCRLRPILAFRKVVWPHDILARHWPLDLFNLMRGERIGFLHHLGVRHCPINVPMSLQILPDELAKIDHRLLSDFFMQLVHSFFSLCKVKSFLVLLWEQVRHVILVVCYKLLFNCFLHIIYSRLLHLNWRWVVVFFTQRNFFRLDWSPVV